MIIITIITENSIVKYKNVTIFTSLKLKYLQFSSHINMNITM